MALRPNFVRGVSAPSLISKFHVLRHCYESKDIAMRVLSSSSSKTPGGPTCYDSRKYGHNLPIDNVCPCFETLPNIPTGVFRDTSGEILGRGAGKCCYYKNPEYFSYHHMSVYDLDIALRPFRKTSPKSDRKPTKYRSHC